MIGSVPPSIHSADLKLVIRTERLRSKDKSLLRNPYS